MNREEFIVKWSNGMDSEQLKNIVLDLDSLFLPPAEGATDKFRDVLHEVQRLIETEGGATESEMKAIWNSLSCAITESERRSQPPAEGAEEILQKYMDMSMIICPLHVVPRTVALDAMHEFATLHARKMARENLREELIRFGKVLKGWGIELPSDILECSIDEYLKSKEQ